MMSLRERLMQAWQRTSTRERMLLFLGLIVVFFGAGWPLLWQPVSQDLARSDVALASARDALDRARRTVDEMAGLRRDARPPRTSDLRAAIERVIDAKALRPSLTALELQSTRVRVTFASVDFAALVAFLAALGSEEQLFPVEAIVAQRVEPGAVRAEFALARPPAP